MKTKTKTLLCTIPANTEPNTPVGFAFKHIVDKGYKAKQIGFTEISNPNNKHFNIAFEVIVGERTIDSASKNFFVVTPQSPINDRFLPLEFNVPVEDSKVILTPTEASGNANITLQVVIRYEGE